MVNNIRPFQRLRNGILIYLQLEDWPADVPIPAGADVFNLRNGPFRPYRDFVLEPDKTVEKFFGWFIIPQLSIEETCKWFQAAMEKHGWVKGDPSVVLPGSAILRYRLPRADVDTEVDGNTYVAISISRNVYVNRTQAMIRRVTIHPYAPSGEEDLEGLALHPTTLKASGIW